MFVDVVKNRRWAPTILIRESKWIDGKSKKITLANLTKLPQPVIDGIRILLKGGTAIDSIKNAFTVVENKPHGQVAAVLGIMKQLKIPQPDRTQKFPLSPTRARHDCRTRTDAPKQTRHQYHAG